MRRKGSTASELLASAVEILKSSKTTFEINEWRAVMPSRQSNFGRRVTDQLVAQAVKEALPGIIEENRMPKALADQKQAELKAARKKTGARAPKHVPKVEQPETIEPSVPQPPVVESVVSAPVAGSIFHPTTQENIMAKEKPAAAEAAPTTTEPTKQEADTAKVKAAMEAKAAKLAKEAAREQAKAAADAKKAEAKAKREAEQAERQKEREAHEAELKASGHSYTGSMLALAERVKQGVYVKSLTGQLRSTDELAVALDAVPPANVVKLGMLVLGHETNKYAALNQGQQSMNYRNLLRGAIKRGEKVGEQVVTLDHVKSVRDQHGFATAEAEVAAKIEAKAKREAAAAAKKEAQAQAKAEADAKKKADAEAKAAAKPAAKAAPKAEEAPAKNPASITPAGADNHNAS